MAAAQNAVAEEGTFTFDTGDIFGEKEIEQLDTEFIPDLDLTRLRVMCTKFNKICQLSNLLQMMTPQKFPRQKGSHN